MTEMMTMMMMIEMDMEFGLDLKVNESLQTME